MARAFGISPVVAFLAMGAIAHGAGLPAPEALPADVAAVVSHVPASVGRVTKAEVGEGLVEKAAEAGYPALPKSGGPVHDELREAALSELLDSVWLRGQAKAMRISVAPREVVRLLTRIKRQEFANAAEYHEFLEEAHFTQRDVRERARLQLIAERIEARVTRRRGAAGFEEFVAAYTKRWRARTVCAPRFMSKRCSNGSAKPAAPDRPYFLPL